MTHLHEARNALRRADEIATEANKQGGDPEAAMHMVRTAYEYARTNALVSIAESLVILAGKGQA